MSSDISISDLNALDEQLASCLHDGYDRVPVKASVLSKILAEVRKSQTISSCDYEQNWREAHANFLAAEVRSIDLRSENEALHARLTECEAQRREAEQEKDKIAGQYRATNRDLLFAKTSIEETWKVIAPVDVFDRTEALDVSVGEVVRQLNDARAEVERLRAVLGEVREHAHVYFTAVKHNGAALYGPDGAPFDGHALAIVQKVDRALAPVEPAPGKDQEP